MLLIDTSVTENTKFTTAMIGCFLRIPLTQHNLAFANLLARDQMNVSLFFPTVQRQQKELANLYDLQFEVVPQIFGTEIVLSYIAEFVEPTEILDPDYTYERIIDTYAKIINNPDFGPSMIELAKSQLAADYQELMEEPANYALDRFFKYWYREKPDYADTFMGSIDEIKKADADQLRKFYNGLKMAPATILSIAKGRKQVNNLLNKYFKISGVFKDFEKDTITIPASKQLINKEENKDNLQAQLLIGYRFSQKMTFKDQIRGLVLANYLAGDSSSRLFTEVREKLGAAYAIEANNYAFNSLFLIQAGLDPSKSEQAKDLIIDEISKIQNGEIDSDLFKKVKKNLINNEKINQDQESWHLARLLRWRLLANYLISDQITEIKKVTVKQMSNFAKELKFKESYILK